MKEITLQLDDSVSLDHVFTLLAPYIQDVKIQLTAPKAEDLPNRQIAENTLRIANSVDVKMPRIAKPDVIPVNLREDISQPEESGDQYTNVPDDIPPVTGPSPAEEISEVNAVSPSSSQTPTIPADFVPVSGGNFTMGSSNGGNDEKPVHQVTLSGFYMGKYEVTQKEWVEVMGTNPSYFKGDNLPVEQVSWSDAVEYCNKRSQKEGLTPAYQISEGVIRCDFKACGYRLPTEAEWEFAAKGGNKAGYTNSEREGVDAAAWYADNSGNKTHPVGTKAPNCLGIYDMSGNVWEWCWDWYGAYSGEAQTDPSGAAQGTARVKRGGSWLSGAGYLRSAYRNSRNPSVCYSVLGFRLVRSAVDSYC